MKPITRLALGLAGALAASLPAAAQTTLRVFSGEEGGAQGRRLDERAPEGHAAEQGAPQAQ